MFQIYLIILIVLLSSCQSINSDLNNTNKDSQEVITDHKPFTDIPPDVFPAEGKMEILYQISLGGQTGLGTTANLEINLGEAGKVSVSQRSKAQWHTINLKHSYQRPVVIMQPLSYNAGSPSLVRIKDVTSNSFKFQIDEWDYLNGSHSTEEVSYLVLEEGIWSFKNGISFEVGKRLVNHNFKQINLQLNLTNPVILTQSQTYNGAPAITTRQRPSGNGFEVRLQEEQAADGIHGKESVGYVAVSQGQDRLGGVAITAGIKENVSHNFSTINFGFSTVVEDQQPIFLAGMQSYNGADPAGVRYKNLTTSEVKVRVEEEKSADTETLHANEDIGYLLLAEIPPVTSAWTKQFGTTESDSVSAIAVNSSNQVIVVGTTEGSIESTNFGITDIFVRKYSNSGNALWTRQFGTNSIDQANAVVVDSLDNIFVTGYTNGSLEGSNLGIGDIFIRKYDTNGNVIWTRQFGTSSNEGAEAIAIDSNDHVVVAGYTWGTIESGNLGFRDIFVRKYNNNGTVLWTKQFGSTNVDMARAIAIGSDNSIVIVGDTSGDLAGSNFGSDDAFVRKYHSNGNVVWTKQFGSFGIDSANGVAVNSNNQIVVVGETAGDLSSSNLGLQDVFVRQYDTDGNSLWTKQFGSADTDIANSVAIDNDDNILVTGETYMGNNTGVYDVFIRQYDNNDNVLWSQEFGTGVLDNDKAYGVAVDSNNNVFIAGFTQGDLENTNVGNNDAFLRKYVYP